MKINDLNLNDRPRERMIKLGAEALSNTELLAILLSTGNKGESVLEMSARLIKDYGLSRLFDMSYTELNKISGIKEAKATRLLALFEIARRIMKEKTVKSTELRTSSDVYDFIKGEYLFLKTECLKVICVNTSCMVIEVLSYEDSDIARVMIPYKKIVNKVINLKAYGIFLIHNHPSGDPTPSIMDIEATRTLLNILKPMNITLFDHLIIGKDKFYSFSDQKTLSYTK